jgi:hypothetical protein
MKPTEDKNSDLQQTSRKMSKTTTTHYDPNNNDNPKETTVEEG